MRSQLTTQSQAVLRRSLLVLAAFTLMVIATLALVDYRASASESPVSESNRTIAEQTGTTEDNPSAVIPAWSIFDRLNALGLLPEQVTEMMRRAVLEHVEARHPGRSCERILGAGQAATEVVERCRAVLADSPSDGDMEPTQACRRILQAPTAVRSLIQRCRAWAEDTQPDDDAGAPPSAVEACRRIAAADTPGLELVERCRVWLADQAESDTPTTRQLCVRILAADSVPETLVERCEALTEGSIGVDRPSRPGRPALPERPDRH